MAHILIADDDAGIRQIIADTLQDFGHTLHMAEDGNEALEILQKNSIRVVLIDSELSTRDDLDILQEIKKNHPHTPIVMMIGMGEENADEILDKGAFATLSKPFNVQELRRIITEAISYSVQAPNQTTETGTKTWKMKLSRKTVVFFASLVLLTSMTGAGIWFFLSQRLSPVKIFFIPYSNISGITFDGQFLWSCDWFNESFYQHKLDAILSLNRTFKKEDYQPTGITWDGKNLWSVSLWSKQIVQHKIGDVRQIEHEFVSPVPEPSAIYYDGQFFWICDAREAKIVKFTIENNQIKVLESTNSPGQKPIGISKDKKFLWTADSRSGMIYKHSSDKDLKVIEVYEFPEELRKEKISCFTSDGKTFWVGTESSQKIYQFHYKHLKLVGTLE